MVLPWTTKPKSGKCGRQKKWVWLSSESLWILWNSVGTRVFGQVQDTEGSKVSFFMSSIYSAIFSSKGTEHPAWPRAALLLLSCNRFLDDCCLCLGLRSLHTHECPGPIANEAPRNASPLTVHRFAVLALGLHVTAATPPQGLFCQ